ncbi:hypothetical protein BDB00DRAFT_856505 [Zychaea mexicana]|uniref:uncharacterized protein n=1 Tax=Zychaea mexicana TaxID=64656 RepID=UPI0022FF3D91|nr:uncharacterized protein BDB00DRAFT_856505 [Zychaea mexicana]KAI9484315.1 hypothetical protein BDB00DRAFT_856505 [Zychaea mexicana]
MHRRNLVMDYSGAFALVWEKGDYENRAHSFKGPNKSNLYAEFLAAYEVLKSTPKTKTILIKTTSAELINAIQNKVDTTFTREVVTLRSELRWEVRNRPGVYFKKVPSRCGLPENDLACAMAEEARKDIEQQQQQQKQQQQQQQALIAQNKAADSGQSLETVLRQRALASMQADNTVSPLSFMSYSSSLASAKTVRPFVAPQIASSSVNQQQDRVDEDGRLAKARKTSYSDTATAHQQVESHTRDPRLRKKAPASQQAHASTSAVVPPLSAPGAQPLQPPQAPQEQQQIRAHPQTRMAGRHLQMVQNIIRPTPETRNTVKNRGLSSERSNDQHAKPTPPSSSPANNTFTAPAQDGESDEEFFDALDYWVGQHYEDLKKDTKGGSENKADDDGEGKADPSSTLSWISDLL